MGELSNAYTFSSAKTESKNHFRDTDVNERILLKIDLQSNRAEDDLFLGGGGSE
jgi:hypothetical protein